MLQGRNYLREGNYAAAYLFFYRHLNLVLNHLRNHPDAKKPESQAAFKPVLDRLPTIFRDLEGLKPRISAAHDEWLRVSAAQRNTQAPRTPLSPYQRHAHKDPALSWNPTSRAKLLHASENQELAVNLAQTEIRRRDAARKATRQAGISEEEEQRRRVAGVWDDRDRDNLQVEYPKYRQQDDDQELRRRMEATRRMLDGETSRQSGASRTDHDRTGSRSSLSSYHYPSISQPAPLQYQSAEATRQRREPDARQHPPRPPKVSLPEQIPYRSELAAPVRPQKVPLNASGQPAARDGVPALPPKTEEDQTQKERFTFRPAAYLENGEPLRPVFLPDRLRHTFLEIASPNTRRGLETCGILCGTAVNNALFISCLLIPDQTCTPDTCETRDESAMFEYCSAQDLLVLGWIHTHPTQTCFMSSRDLHTQSGYQVMMPESIAIVCSPSYKPS